MSNELAPVDQLKKAIKLQEAEYNLALPKHIPAEKFVRVLQTAVSVNQNLIGADRASLFGAAQRAAAMGLLPDGREGAIVEFGGKCQFMPMIAGILRLARNSGEIASMDAQIVCKNDKFQYRLGIDEQPVHEPDWFGDRGEMLGVYAVAKLKDGSVMVEIMNKDELDKIRSVSRSGSGASSPWTKWGSEMSRKSVLRRLCKRLPSSSDVDIDEVFRKEEEQYDAPASAPVAASAEPATQKRTSRLRAVVTDQATGEITDVPHTDVPPVQEHESPI